MGDNHNIHFNTTRTCLSWLHRKSCEYSKLNGLGVINLAGAVFTYGAITTDALYNVAKGVKIIAGAIFLKFLQKVHVPYCNGDVFKGCDLLQGINHIGIGGKALFLALPLSLVVLSTSASYVKNTFFVDVNSDGKSREVSAEEKISKKDQIAELLKRKTEDLKALRLEFDEIVREREEDKKTLESYELLKQDFDALKKSLDAERELVPYHGILPEKVNSYTTESSTSSGSSSEDEFANFDFDTVNRALNVIQEGSQESSEAKESHTQEESEKDALINELKERVDALEEEKEKLKQENEEFRKKPKIVPMIRPIQQKQPAADSDYKPKTPTSSPHDRIIVQQSSSFSKLNVGS